MKKQIQTTDSKWAARLGRETFYFETKAEAEQKIKEVKGDFTLYVKGNGRWVAKRKGFLLSTTA